MALVPSLMSKIGLRFDNSYARLPKIMLTELNPVPVKKPKLILLNYALSKELGLDFSEIDKMNLSNLFSGNSVPEGARFIAQAYAGHQFGYFTMLGDGRAVLMGEHLTFNNKRFDIQFKGSGQTPYSRNGDGRASLGPVLREYIISEAMNALGIPSTRSLAVVTTGETVMRESPLPGAVLTRVASSHIRVGTFQYLLAKNDLRTLSRLVDYTINRHFPDTNNSENKASVLFKAVMKKQIELIINWMRVGFIHGVMNTDNVAVSGETIDYGPCAFMDVYNPKTVFSSIDYSGRYSFENQPSVAHWNLLRFAEALLPLIHDEKNKAIKIVEEIMDSYGGMYKNLWIKMMKNKLGLLGEDDGDEELIKSFLLWMKKNDADYTNTFISLTKKNFLKNNLFKDVVFVSWFNMWKKRLEKNKGPKQSSLLLMQKSNPLVIPRNHNVEKALSAAVFNGDFSPTNDIIKILKKPYNDRPEIIDYQRAPKPNEQINETFCGT